MSRMREVVPPDEWSPPDIPGRTLVLAGGISGCPDWQSQFTYGLQFTPIEVFNPRRQNFPMGDPAAAEAQIRWEFKHLRRAQEIAFWFPCETLCPIVLFELGKWLTRAKPLYIGCHPDYQRRQDVVIQTQLERPEIQVVSTLDELVVDVKYGRAL